MLTLKSETAAAKPYMNIIPGQSHNAMFASPSSNLVGSMNRQIAKLRTGFLFAEATYDGSQEAQTP